MSKWTYISGVVEVDSCFGVSQADCDWNVMKILEHLPKVEGSEGPMHVYVNRRAGTNISSSVDEFDKPSNLGNGYYGNFEAQTGYILTLDGSLRDTEYEDIVKDVTKWITRLGRRLSIQTVLVKIYRGWGDCTLLDDAEPFRNVNYFEDENWMKYILERMRAPYPEFEEDTEEKEENTNEVPYT